MLALILLVLLVFGVTSTKTTLIVYLALLVFGWIVRRLLKSLAANADK